MFSYGTGGELKMEWCVGLAIGVMIRAFLLVGSSNPMRCDIVT